MKYVTKRCIILIAVRYLSLDLPFYEEVYIHWNCINKMTKPPKEDIYDGGSDY